MLALKLKWAAFRIVQLLGFVMVGAGAYPFFRPFVSAMMTPPQFLDSLVASLGVSPTAAFALDGGGLRAIVYIAIGAIVVWVATSRRFH